MFGVRGAKSSSTCGRRCKAVEGGLGGAQSSRRDIGPGIYGQRLARSPLHEQLTGLLREL